MRNSTRLKFNSYVSQIALLNGVADAAVKFEVAPAVAQTLEEKIKESSDFLSAINILPVVEQTGQKIGIAAARPMASRTNTGAGNRRTPRNALGSDGAPYFCRKTDYDYAIPYGLWDSWRHKDDFQTIARDVLVKQQGRDRIMIGFNGTSAAAATDRDENPLLQDVNEGWLHKLRTQAPERVLDDGDLTTGVTKAIYVAPDVEAMNTEGDNAATAKADYNTLDALALDALELLDPWHRSDTDLVVIVGWKLMKDKQLNLLNAAGSKATEAEAASRILTLPHQLAGKRAIIVPFFPETSLMVTSLDNLSIYWQEETRRRALVDEPSYDQVANYESVNESFEVEDLGRASLIENIVLGEKPA